MRIGVSSWTYGDLGLEEITRRVARLGFDGVELFGDLAVKPATARCLMVDQGLEIMSVSPDDVDVTGPDQATRREGIDYYMRLCDWAAELGSPMIVCRGAVGRVMAFSTFEAERRLYLDAVRTIAEHARGVGVKVVLEILNRYESHLLTGVDEGLAFLQDLDRPDVGLLLDAYHMNIEESDLPAAVCRAGDKLQLFHVADSNRQAVGRGHTDFPAVLRALKQTGYRRDLVLECVAAGPNPFTWDRGPGTHEVLEGYLRESLQLLRHFWSVV